MTRKYRLIECDPVYTPDTAMAWALGFIAADGSISTVRNTLRVRLAAKDRIVLVHLKRILAVSNPIKAYMASYSYKGKVYAKPSVSLCITDKQLVLALASWGIGPRKSESLLFPSRLPRKLQSGFVRGYWDGNGTINISQHKLAVRDFNVSVASGSGAFIYALREVIVDHHISVGAINTATNCHTFRISALGNNLKSFFSWMYYDAEYYLPRKKKALEEIIRYKHKSFAQRVRELEAV